MSEANEAKQQGSRGDESRKGPGELPREQGSELGDERTTDGREDLDETKDRASTQLNLCTMAVTQRPCRSMKLVLSAAYSPLCYYFQQQQLINKYS
jgi:hypothetical protein